MSCRSFPPPALTKQRRSHASGLAKHRSPSLTAKKEHQHACEDEDFPPVPEDRERSNSKPVVVLSPAFLRITHGLVGAVRKFQKHQQGLFNRAEVAFQLYDGDSDRPKHFGINKIYITPIIVPHAKLLKRFTETEDSQPDSGVQFEHVSFRHVGGTERINLNTIFNVCMDEDRRRRKPSVRVLAVGIAGSGKTIVFTKKGPFDWLSGNGWKDFVLVVSRELRDETVRSAANLAELFMSEYDMSEAEQREVCQYVSDNTEKVCLILDGFDEMDMTTCSDYMLGILDGTKLPGIRLIVTSRPTPEVFALARKAPFDRRVELIGFEPQDVPEYISKVLDQDAATDLIAHVRRDTQLSSLMATPYFAMKICELYCFRPVVPSCMAELFDFMMLRTAETKGGKNCDSWSAIPLELQQKFLRLGSFAFKMLIRRQFVYRQSALAEHKLDKNAILGLMVAADGTPFDDNRQWKFSHPIMPESFAANFAARCVCHTSKDVAWLVKKLVPLTAHLHIFWIQLAARLDNERVNMLIKSLLTAQAASAVDDDRRLTVDLATLDDFYLIDQARLDSAHSLLSATLDRTGMERLAAALLNDVVEGNAVTRVEAEMSCSRKETTDSEFLRALLQLWTQAIPLTTLAMIPLAISTFDQSTAQNVADFLLPNDRAQQYREHAMHMQTATRDSGVAVTATHSLYTLKTPQRTSLQDFSFPESNPDSMRDTTLGTEIVPSYDVNSPGCRDILLLAFRCFKEYSAYKKDALLSMQELHNILDQAGLDFSGHRMSKSECEIVTTVLKCHHMAVTGIKLRSCRIACGQAANDSGDSASALLTAMRECRKLITFDMEENGLQAHHLHLLADTIDNNHHQLRHVSLNYNEIGDAGLARLRASLVQCSNLTRLGLGNCQISSASLPVLRDIMRHCRLLKHIDLQECGLDDSGLGSITEELSSSELRSLSLRKNMIRCRSVPLKLLSLKKNPLRSGSNLQLHRILCYQTVLTNLDISYNIIGDKGLDGIQGALETCSALANVKLEGIGITTSSLSSLASLIATSWPRLITLDLNTNNFQRAVLKAHVTFVDAVGGSSSLSELHMPCEGKMNPALFRLVLWLDTKIPTVSVNKIRLGEELEATTTL